MIPSHEQSVDESVTVLVAIICADRGLHDVASTHRVDEDGRAA